MAIEDLAAWLAPYGVEDFEGRCVFTYRDEIAVSVDATADGGTLFLSAVIGTVLQEPDAAFLKRLLELNLMGQATRGASFAIDPAGPYLVLWLCWPISNLDIDTFQSFFAAFLDTASKYREELFANPVDQPENARPIGGGYIQV